MNQHPAGSRTASTFFHENEKKLTSEIFSFHYSVIEDRSKQSMSVCRTKFWQMKAKQTRVLHVTHAVRIKMNLLLLSADRPSIMSADTGQDNEDQTACCESPSQNTHTVRNTPQMSTLCQGALAFFITCITRIQQSRLSVFSLRRESLWNKF